MSDGSHLILYPIIKLYCDEKNINIILPYNFKEIYCLIKEESKDFYNRYLSWLNKIVF